MHFYRKLAGRGIFSVMELSVVLVVLGVVSAIVGPRMSHGDTASPLVAQRVLVGQLRDLRAAIDTYSEEHAGRWPRGDALRITQQLTQFTDESGTPSTAQTAQYRFGPYLREIPPLPIGSNRGLTTLKLPAETRDSGWIYNPASGNVRPNIIPNDCDASGRSYSSY